MKGHLLSAFSLIGLLCHHPLLGQPQPATEIFPTYQQIKPEEREIIDFGKPKGMIKVERNSFILLDPRRGKPITIVDGKPSDEDSPAKKLLADRLKRLESKSLEKPKEPGSPALESRPQSKQP